MSHPSRADETATPAANNPLTERLILFLMPYFLTVTSDRAAAKLEILQTLTDYGARTRSELITAARIIALSFSSLDLLAESKAMEMSPSLRLKYRTCANSLDRTSQRNETALNRSLACQDPTAAAVGNDITEAEADAMFQETQAMIASCRNRLSNARPTTKPAHAHPTHKRQSPLMAAFHQPAPPSTRPAAA